MRTVGIICEYNPFHTGHKRQIDILRSMGYDCVVCVMSGNFTQRGELAILDKYTRAKSAVYGGADLVVELPFPYSSFSAEGFADAGVHILSRLGVDAISFGSECGDLALLERIADAISSPMFVELYNELQRGGLGSAAAYFEALRRASGDKELLSNDILAISYISAIKRQNAKLNILPIKREGAAYNEKDLTKGTFPSASAIREAIKASNKGIDDILSGYVPESSLNALVAARDSGLAPVVADNIEKEIISFFRLMTPDEIVSRAISRSGGGKQIAEDGCGIIERICRAAKDAETLDGLLRSSYNSKYTDARINRVILFSLFGVSDKLTHSLPEYTVLLAASERGRGFLSSIRKICDFPIVTKPSDADAESIQRRISEGADMLYASASPKKIPVDHFVKSHPFML